MIGMFILSIGLLGLISMQMTGFTLTTDSYLRTTATILANDMIDRMRANSAATQLGTASPYNNPTGAATANPNCLGLNSSGGTLSSAQCTAAQMAGQDFYEWNANISGAAATSWYPAVIGQLPSGKGIVCIDSTPFDGTPIASGCDNIVSVPGRPIYVIKIWWIERKDANSTGTTRHYITSFAL